MLNLSEDKRVQLDLSSKYEETLDFIQSQIKGTNWDGHVFAVGGCVRDKLLGMEMHDIDLVVDVENGGLTFAEWLCRKNNCFSASTNPVVFPTFGTAKFNLRSINRLKDVDIECVHTRKEQYKDSTSRNPEQVFGTIEDDAKRRDLTINSLYINLSDMTVLDPTGLGLEDLTAKRIKTTNDPSIIFSEDPLRLLRVIRFATKLGWGIDKDTWVGIVSNAYRIDIVSQERIKEELTKILVCQYPSYGINRLRYSGLLEIVLPEIYRLIGVSQGVQHFGDVYEHTMAVVDQSGDDPITRWGALFHDCGKPEARVMEGTVPRFFNHENIGEGVARNALKRLKMSGLEINFICSIVKHHMRFKQFGDKSPSKKAIRKFIAEVGTINMPNILSVINADNISHSPAYCMHKQVPLILDTIEAMCKEENVSDKPKLPVNGKDIMDAFNLHSGPRIGRIMKFVEGLYFEDPTITKEYILQTVKKQITDEKI